MTREQFETYKFSINTEVKFRDEWHKVTEVNFEDCKIGIDTGYYLDYSEIEDIRTLPTKS